MATTILWKNTGAAIAQLVERQTDKAGAILIWGGFESPVRQGMFLPQSASSADFLTLSVPPPCAIACIYTCAVVKNPKHWQPYRYLDTGKYHTHRQEWVAITVPYQVRRPEFPARDKEVLKRKKTRKKTEKKKTNKQTKRHSPPPPHTHIVSITHARARAHTHTLTHTHTTCARTQACVHTHTHAPTHPHTSMQRLGINFSPYVLYLFATSSAAFYMAEKEKITLVLGEGEKTKKEYMEHTQALVLSDTILQTFSLVSVVSRAKQRKILNRHHKKGVKIFLHGKCIYSSTRYEKTPCCDPQRVSW